jgi:hypothetical protein
MKGEDTMIKSIVALSVIFISMGFFSLANTAGNDARARSAYKMIVSEVDTNGDGKLSVSECMAMYKDKSMATKNCTFWDANKDGIITEDEYVSQGSSLNNKNKGSSSKKIKP